MYANAQYIKDIRGNVSTIRVDINNVTTYVGIDPANTTYAEMMKLVEEGKLVIAPAE